MNNISTSGRTDRSQRTKRVVGLAILSAIIVVLQLVATFVRVGTFPLSLVMIPIVVGAAVYGPGAGAFLGGVFGLIVTIATITGSDAGAYILWAAKPLATVILCFVKGICAGYAAGLVYRAISKKHVYLGVVVGAIVCPVVNTGLFTLAMATIFKETLINWAAGLSLFYYTFVGLIGINFLIEMLINIILSPAIVRIIRVNRKQ